MAFPITVFLIQGGGGVERIIKIPELVPFVFLLGALFLDGVSWCGTATVPSLAGYFQVQNLKLNINLKNY